MPGIKSESKLKTVSPISRCSRPARRPGFFLILAGCLLLLASACVSHGQPAFQTVPAGSFLMDGFGRLAGKGVFQPLAASDFRMGRSFTRTELAGVLLDSRTAIRESGITLPPEDQALLAALARDLAPELQWLGGTPESVTPPLGEVTSGSIWTGWLYGEAAQRDSAPDQKIGAPELTLLGVSGNLHYGGSLTGKRRVTDSQVREKFHELDRFYIAGTEKNYRWELGRTNQWVGAASTGSLWLGDSSPSMYTGRLDAEIDLGAFLGKWRVESLLGGFGEDGRSVYVINRTARKAIAPDWSVGVIDSVRTTLTPNPLMLALPSLAYQSLFLSDIDARWNIIMGLEAVYHPTLANEAYLQWMVDDINNPFDPGDSVPKKTGILVGYRHRFGSRLAASSRITIEYATIDRRSYEATRAGSPHMAWTRSDLPMAWPFGANNRTLAVNAEHRLSDRFWLQGGFVENQVKVGPGRTQTVTFHPRYDITPTLSVGLVWQDISGDQSNSVIGVRALASF